MRIKQTIKWGSLLFSSLILAACGTGEESSEAAESNNLSIGVVGEVSADVWSDVASRLEDDGINLDIVTFSDYAQPNRALEEGDLDLNAFQHTAFLTDYTLDLGESNIVPVGYTIMSPSYVFAVDEIPDAESIPDGVTAAVSNSPSSAERSLLSLEALGLIELDDNAGFAPTIDDVTENHKDVELLELEPSQLARALGDAELITIGGDMLADAGLNPEDAIYIDTDNIENVDALKKNFIAARKDNADSEVIQRVVDEYQSEETASLIDEISEGSSIPIWEEEDTSREDFEAVLNEQINES